MQGFEHIRRVDGGYVAHIRNVTGELNLDTPTPRHIVATRMREFGKHSRDVDELLRFADRAWLVAHPEEDDPGEFFTITKRDIGYSVLSERRTGFVTEIAKSTDDVLAHLVARGFAREAVQAQLDEIECLWERDMTTNRRALGSLDVERRDGGYVWRSFGNAWVRSDPISADELKRIFYWEDPAKLDAIIERADREWGADRA